MGEERVCFIQPNAGLCNQLFMIATAYAHAKRNGYTLRLGQPNDPERHYWSSFLHRVADKRGEPNPRKRVWREPRFSYVPIPPDAQNLVGYFQSSKYFQDVSGEIRSLFMPPDATIAAARTKHANLLTPDLRDRGVVVHIRRGDYMLGSNKIRHGILDQRYYERAIAAARATLGADCPLLVVSDDLAWCRTQPWLAGASCLFVEEPDDCTALWLMSQFRHFILSNSTFSWWGAWLSGQPGSVWAPDTWFGPGMPRDWHDIYEPHWVRLPIT